jgi:hypothetical protein
MKTPKSSALKVGILPLIVCTCVIGSTACGQTVAASSDKHDSSTVPFERVLHFPVRRAVGRLWIRPATPVWDLGWGWKEYAEAFGEVSIPAGQAVLLDVRQDADQDLESLSAVKSEDLQALSLGDASVSNESLRSIARLTGLKYLDVSTGIENDGLAALAGLKQLEQLNLGETKITGAALTHLRNFPRLRELSFPRVELRNDDLAHIKNGGPPGSSTSRGGKEAGK